MNASHAFVLSGKGVGPLVAGGKGSALDKLIALEARVPVTGVISASAHMAFEAVEEVAAFVDGLRADDIPEPRDHEAEREAVDAFFLSVPLPAEIAAAVDELASGSAHRCADRVRGGSPTDRGPRPDQRRDRRRALHRPQHDQDPRGESHDQALALATASRLPFGHMRPAASVGSDGTRPIDQRGAEREVTARQRGCLWVERLRVQ